MGRMERSSALLIAVYLARIGDRAPLVLRVQQPSMN